MSVASLQATMRSNLKRWRAGRLHTADKKRVKQNRGKKRPRTAQQAAWQGYRLARRLAGPTKVIMGGLNEAVTGAYALGARSGIQGFYATTAVIGLDNVVKERFNNGIIQSAAEDGRIGSLIMMQYLLLDIVTVYVAVMPDFGAGYPFNEAAQIPPLRIRTLVVYETDSTEDVAAKQQPPTLQDIFQGCSAALGTPTATVSPENMYKIMHGTYKPKDNESYTGGASTDRNLMRQRNFEILYDNMAQLKWPRSAGALHLAQASEVNADVIEMDEAHLSTQNIKLKINRKCHFLQPSTTAINECKGNLYLYMFANYASPTGALWPDGGPAPITVPALSAFCRTRAMLYWSDI